MRVDTYIYIYYNDNNNNSNSNNSNTEIHYKYIYITCDMYIIYTKEIPEAWLRSARATAKLHEGVAQRPSANSLCSCDVFGEVSCTRFQLGN